MANELGELVWMEMKHEGGDVTPGRKDKWVGHSLKDEKVQFLCQGLFLERLTTGKFYCCLCLSGEHFVTRGSMLRYDLA